MCYSVCNKLNVRHLYFNDDDLANNVPIQHIAQERLSSYNELLKLIQSYSIDMRRKCNKKCTDYNEHRCKMTTSSIRFDHCPYVCRMTRDNILLLKTSVNIRSTDVRDVPEILISNDDIMSQSHDPNHNHIISDRLWI